MIILHFINYNYNYIIVIGFIRLGRPEGKGFLENRFASYLWQVPGS